MEYGSIKRGLIFLSIVILFIAGGYVFYCIQAAQTYERAQQAYSDHDWNTAKTDFRSMQTVYKYSFSNNQVDVEQYFSISTLMSNLEKAKAQNSYEKVHLNYEILNSLAPDFYTSMKLQDEEIEYFVNLISVLEENNQFSEAIRIYQFMDELALLDDTTSIDESTLAKLHYEFALNLIENGAYYKAIQELDFVNNNFAKYYNAATIDQHLNEIRYLLAGSLIESGEYELALNELTPLLAIEQEMEESTALTNLYLETKVNYAAALHENHEYESEIVLLKGILKNNADFAQTNDIENKLVLAYEAYADQFVLYGNYYSAMVNYELAIENTTDSANIARITEKNEKVKAVLLTDNGEAGQLILNRIADEICSGGFDFPDIIDSIPETANKAIVCNGSQFTLPASQTAQNLSELRYVINIQDKFNDVQYCRYDNRKRFLVRRQKYKTVSLYDVTLQSQSSATDIYGSNPVSCPDYYLFNDYLAERIPEELKAKVSAEERTESAQAFRTDPLSKTDYFMINRYSSFLLGEEVPQTEIEEWLNEYLP